MLLNKRKDTPYITIFKMPSGEEFICNVTEETDTGYHVTKPFTLGRTQSGMQFVPFLMLADPDKVVFVPKPVVEGIPAPQMQSQYESATTGIALPHKSSIII